MESEILLTDKSHFLNPDILTMKVYLNMICMWL